jgi:cell division protein FtsL
LITLLAGVIQVSENGNGRKAVWMYAVILFSSAFIVLLLTAYSQIKLNKNITRYEGQIHDEKQQNINFKTDLYSLQFRILLQNLEKIIVITVC